MTSERQPSEGPSDLSSAADPAALVFDLDGTLVDTVGARIDAWLATFAEVGIPADRAHVAGLIGSDGRRLAREVAEVAGRSLDHDRAEAIDRRAGEAYDRINLDPQPLPGARALVAALESSPLSWAIATSSRPEQVDDSIAVLGLERPPRLIDGSSVAHAKPAPDLLLLAAEQLGISPRRCWYVGDSTWDMLAARAATMVSIGVMAGSAADVLTLQRSGAQVVVQSLDAITDELRRRHLVSA